MPLHRCCLGRLDLIVPTLTHTGAAVSDLLVSVVTWMKTTDVPRVRTELFSPKTSMLLVRDGILRCSAHPLFIQSSARCAQAHRHKRRQQFHHHERFIFLESGCTVYLGSAQRRQQYWTFANCPPLIRCPRELLG